MDAAAYRSLRDLQDRHWWFVGRRSVVESLIRRFAAFLPDRRKILEAGCGYGGNLAMLSKFGEVEAFEYDKAAREYAATLAKRPVAYGHLPDQVGFDTTKFDLIAMLDVLEHIEDDAASLRALRARLAPGGSVVLTVPALPWLWSTHDEIHHHKRRYTRAGLIAVLQDAGFTPVSVGYFNTLLFPLALLQRIALRFRGREHGTDVLPRHPLNWLFSQIFAFERRFAGRIPMPIGLSLYAIARAAS